LQPTDRRQQSARCHIGKVGRPCIGLGGKAELDIRSEAASVEPVPQPGYLRLPVEPVPQSGTAYDFQQCKISNAWNADSAANQCHTDARSSCLGPLLRFGSVHWDNVGKLLGTKLQRV
jgi:hypothetical protein